MWRVWVLVGWSASCALACGGKSIEVSDSRLEGERPLDGKDTNGDGYDFPVLVDRAEEYTTPCAEPPLVELPRLVARSGCKGAADLVIGWVHDCMRCDHVTTVVIGNRGTTAVDAMLLGTAEGKLTSASLGVLAPLTWLDPVEIQMRYDPLVQVLPTDESPVCDPAEATLGPLDHAACPRK